MTDPDTAARRSSLLLLILGGLLLIGGVFMYAVSSPSSPAIGKEVPLSALLKSAENQKGASVFVDEAASVLVLKSANGTLSHADMTSLTATPAVSHLMDVGAAPAPLMSLSQYSFMRGEVALLGPLFSIELWLVVSIAGASFCAIAIFTETARVKASRPQDSEGATHIAGVLGGRPSKKKYEVVEKPSTRFSDVIGCDEAVQDVKEVVDVLCNPEPYLRLGARAPRGVLLSGPPGVGKTLLARAAAGEADAAFFAVSATDFVEMYVGVGSSRVRDLFSRARSNQPSVIFIDELDAVGKTRSAQGASAGSHEWENTLNALLVEMDGFGEADRVVVVAATNRPEILDQALTRPGRFDRKIAVSTPDVDGCIALFEHYMAGKPTNDDLDLRATARRCTGLVGADIANIANEAALAAARRKAPCISRDDLEESLQTFFAGRAHRNRRVSASDKQIVAHHEAGHALVAWLTPNAVTPEFVTVVPRGGSGGATWMTPRDTMLTKRSASADLMVLLAGRAAEELLLDGDFTSGAADDLRRATALASRMVFELGMDRDLSVRDPRNPSAHHAAAHDAVSVLLRDAHDKAHALLLENRAPLLALTEHLETHREARHDDLVRLWGAPRSLGSSPVVRA
jgi:cell division protease FtsH